MNKTRKDKKGCSFCDKKEWIREVAGSGKYYCSGHYYQLKCHGYIKNRTKYNVNKIIEKGSYSVLELYNNKSEKVAETKIDNSLVGKVTQFKWYLQKSGNGYVVRNENGRTIRLHRFIMNPQGKMVVDHISGDTLDNRVSNLRICSISTNNMNRVSSKNRGVYWKKNISKWQVMIGKNNKQIYLGVYKSLNEAMGVRRDAERKYGLL